jgi:SMC interacting uncharacterized protein involved in chromosome segregation
MMVDYAKAAELLIEKCDKQREQIKELEDGAIQVIADSNKLQLKAAGRIEELETENKRLQNDHNCVASLCDSIDEFGEPMKDTQWTNLGERIYEIVVELYDKIKELEAEITRLRNIMNAKA